MTSHRAMASGTRDWLPPGGARELIGPRAWGVRADWPSGSDVTSRDGEAFEVRVSGGGARRARRRRSPFRSFFRCFSTSRRRFSRRDGRCLTATTMEDDVMIPDDFVEEGEREEEGIFQRRGFPFVFVLVNCLSGLCNIAIWFSS